VINSQEVIDLSWMPQLLEATEEIHTRSLTLITAAAQFCEWFDQHGLATAEIQEKVQEECRLRTEIPELENLAKTSECEHKDFHAHLLQAMNDGHEPDSEAACRVLRLEITAIKSQEQLKQAQARLDLLTDELLGTTARVGSELYQSTELRFLKSEWKAASQHRKKLVSFLSQLGIDLDDRSLCNAWIESQRLSSLFAYFSFLEPLIWLQEVSPDKADAVHSDEINTIKDHAIRLQASEPVDASLLFSEICITLAQQHLRVQLDFPVQPPTKEDLTEF